MKLINLILLVLIIGGVFSSDSQSDSGSSDDSGSGGTNVNVNDSVTIDGQTYNKHFSWSGSEISYHSNSEISVSYDEQVFSSTFSYTIVRDDDCDSRDDSGIEIKHQGKSGRVHTISLHNFTCFENNSNPTVDIQPDDGDISCKVVRIPRGGRLDCKYDDNLSEPGYLNMTLKGNDTLTTYNSSRLRELVSSYFKVPITRVNVTSVPLSNNTLMLRIDIGPGPTSSPTANSILSGITLQKLIDAKIVKAGTESGNSSVIIVSKPMNNSSSRFSSCPAYFLEGFVITILFLVFTII